MQNYTNNNTARRYTAHVSALGTTQIHLRNPYIVGWWSAAFPGFGHLLLSKDIVGLMLFIWEFLVNINANVNLAIIYSFQGEIDHVIDVLNTKWLLVYTPVYFFGIWDSYRAAVDMNKMFVLADREGHPFNSFTIGPFGVNYLGKKNPFLAFVWSLFVPGLGHFYISKGLHIAFIGVFSLVSVFYMSNTLEAITLLASGESQQATSVLKPEFFLFLPSMYGFAMYESYVSAVESNKLFEKEQRRYFKDTYQSPDFHILKGEKVE